VLGEPVDVLALDVALDTRHRRNGERHGEKGFDPEGGHTERYRGAECEIECVPTMKLEIVRDDQVQKVIEAIEVGATTGTVGDGKIVVLPLGDAGRIRTGAHCGDAI
jgi:nitrogen regulatory protein PII